MHHRICSALAALLLLGSLIAPTAWARPPAEPVTMVKTMGWHRTQDSAIWVWKGNKSSFRTLTHELTRMTGDPKFMEGLTSYFTTRALEIAQRQPTYPEPQGRSLADLRRWSRGIRADAHSTLQTAFGVDVDMRKITICNDKTFGRCHLRDFGEPWVSHPGQPGSYGNSKSRVQQIVELVGEGTVRRAYFQGDVGGLRAALAQARRQRPSTLPDWIDL